MDYKELSKRMRKRYLDNLNGLLQKPDDVFSDCNKAATAITDLLARAEAAEERAEMLENANRILSGRITKAEARAEKAERERDAYKEMIYKERPCAFFVEYTGNWNPECIRCDRCTKEYRPKFRLREQEEE